MLIEEDQLIFLFILQPQLLLYKFYTMTLIIYFFNYKLIAIF